MSLYITKAAILRNVVWVVLVIASLPCAAQLDKPGILLATPYHVPNKAKLNWVREYWVSEKLDGIRAYWTGQKLLTKQGNVIYSPLSFTSGWPTTPMDGELWVARGQFEKVSSIVRRHKADKMAWKGVRFMMFDLPTHLGRFSDRVSAMQQLVKATHSDNLRMIKQRRITSQTALDKHLNEVVNGMGEGLMLHHQDAIYHEGRSKQLMKLKKYYDAEAVVIAHFKGKGKYQNHLGSMLVRMPNGIEFKLGSGFSDLQRKNPPAIGSTITYKYFSKTARGVPRFASFMRIRKSVE